MIKLGFYGAAGEVTGSCYVLTTDHARVMIDMGMHQGEREAIEHNRRMPPSTPQALMLWCSRTRTWTTVGGCRC